MDRVKAFLYFFVLGLLPLFSSGVKPYTPVISDPILEPWRWRELKELRGLGILSMTEAADGTMWFGCIGGLARYDGRQMEHIPFDEGLLSGIVHDPNRKPWGKSVLCLRDGSLLAVVESGLVQWTGGAWKVIIRDVGHSTFESRLEQAEDGTIWLLTSDALWRISEDLTKPEQIFDSAGKQRLTSFCRDPNGDVWVVRTVTLESSELIHIPMQDGRPRGTTERKVYRIDVRRPGPGSSICADDSGNIWYVDLRCKGVLILDVDMGTWKTLSHLGGNYHILMKDRRGGIWASGSGKLRALDPPGAETYSATQLGLPNINLSLYESSAGKWWLFGQGGNVHTLDMGQDQWLTYTGLHYECETADSRQWFIAENKHVVSHDPATGKWVEYGLVDGLPDDPRSLHRTRQGHLWAVGSHGKRAAFSIFNGKVWPLYERPEFATIIWAGAAFEAADGAMWLGAMGDPLSTPGAGGALQFDVTADGRIRSFKHHPPPEFPYAIHRFGQTPDGVLWIGSPTIHSYDPATATRRVVSELPGMFTYDLVLDGNQNLWAAKGQSGVYRKEEEGWRQYSLGEALGGRLIVDLLPLQDGTLLAASDGGISRFDGKSWAGSVFTDDFGMSNRGGNMRQSTDGALWFNFNRRDTRSLRVTMNRVGKSPFCTVCYKPDQLAPNAFIGEYLEQVDSAGHIHVSWGGEDAWLDTPSEELQFSWRLNGGAWSPYSDETGRTFVGLGRGGHTLEVRARDRDFNVDPTPAVGRFTVAPAIWQRPWFIVMVLLIIGGTATFVWMLVHFHEKRLKDRALHLQEMDQMKTGFFTNISHEMNTPLGLIREPLERLLNHENETNADRERLLDIAMRNTDRLGSLISQILDFRKLELGKVRLEKVEGDVAHHVRESLELLQPLAKKKQVSCVFECGEECIGWFDPDKLKKIVSNLVGNAIKYTAAGGRVRVTLKRVEDADHGPGVCLVVEDSGHGVDPEHLSKIFDRFYRVPEESIVDGSGIGLNLVKELVELWGGKIQAESPIHADPESPGTRFTVRLPIAYEKGDDS